MQGTEYGDQDLKSAMASDLRQRLIDCAREGRPMRVYCGYDPTSTDLHLGHTITMRKLRQFQELGHDVTFLIGSYTALVGDPSDKNKARPILTEQQVDEYAKTYTEQAFRVSGSQENPCPIQRRMAEQTTLDRPDSAGPELHGAAVPGA